MLHTPYPNRFKHNAFGRIGDVSSFGLAPSGSGETFYANTAFVSPSGDDGTGVVGYESMPFATMTAALDALGNLVSTAAKTLAILSSNTGDNGYIDDNFAKFTNGLTIKGWGGPVSVGGIDLFGDVVSVITLDDVSLEYLNYPDNDSSYPSLNVVGVGTATIQTLTANGAAANDGSAGIDGSPIVGSSGSSGSDGDGSHVDGYPGLDGESVSASGGNGQAGDNGQPAHSGTLSGTISVTTLQAIGGAGGAGGAGGDGSTAIGGVGGNGGNGYDDGNGTPANGGNGGNGGNATANGGDGGSGGNGGNGGSWLLNDTAYVTSHTLTGGAGGGAGAAGGAGSATAVSEGLGGASFNGGSSGSNGSDGSASAVAGSIGVGGSNGSDGILS